jgi:hypothetical protein
MSTQQPGAPRRRRIAGERRGLRDEPPATAARSVDVAEPPVDRSTDESAVAPPRRFRLAPQVVAPEVPPGASVVQTGTAPTTWWGSRASLLTLGAALAVLVALLACIALGVGPFRGFSDVDTAQEAQRAGETAAAAAESAATEILAYHHQRMDADRAAATEYMTDDFAEKYSETFTKVVEPAAAQTKARVTAEVQGSAVIRSSELTARIVLFIDQTTVSTANDTPQSALNRVEFVLVKESDDWLVDDITSY